MAIKKEQANLDFVSMEHEVLDFWKNEDCFNKLVEQNKNGKRYRFLDGPLMRKVFGLKLKLKKNLASKTKKTLSVLDLTILQRLVWTVLKNTVV